jgi:acyl carrier protein
MIKDRLETIFRQSFEIEQFTEDLSIDSVPGWDSMAHVGLILALQREFSVQISPVNALELTNVKDIIKFLVNQGVSSN